MQDILIYDCECKTNGTFKDPKNTMNFLCGVCYSYNKDQYFIFDNSIELISALNENICISFNGLNFDTRLLLGNSRKWRLKFPFFKIVSRETIWQEFDLFLCVLSSFKKSSLCESTKQRSPGGLNLNDLCKFTIKKEKIDVKFGKCTNLELIEYCLNDVRITRQLFEFILKNGFIRSPKYNRVNINSRYLSYFRSNIQS
jgi:predicted PolB exonuclease-like 3'-5' exonuclease